jgi:hypothetical protein
MADPSETTQVSLHPRDPESAELLDAVRALSAQIGGLQSELQALRSQTRALPPPSDAPAWDQAPPVRREKSAWMRTLDHPGPRPPAVPRLLLEIVFLVAVAGAAAIAELEPFVIAILMACAWALVAIAEWLVEQAARRQAAVSAMPVVGAGAVVPEDPSWFAPPLERAFVEEPEPPFDDTAGETSTPPPRLPPRAED